MRLSISGRNLDDPTLWVLTTHWADVGSYRRALSSYEVQRRAGLLQPLGRAARRAVVAACSPEVWPP